IFKTLKKLFPVFGTVYVREILYRSKIDEGRSAEEIREEECSRIIESINSFQKELNEPPALLYRCPDAVEIFSVIVLHHRRECDQESFPSVNEGIRSVLKTQFHEERITTQKDLLLKEIQKELEHTQRALQNIFSATVRDPGEFERIGNILLLHVGEIFRGTVQVELPNPFDSEIPIHISLDPKFSPVQNAQRYFEKAKKARLANAESERRRRLYEEREKSLRVLDAGLQKCTSTDELKAWLSQHTNTLKTMNIIVEKEKDSLPPFRIFSVAGELEVWVGKSSANNDLLTMKYAKPNDLWFHVRGASGSHTVLKVHGKASPPSKEAIHQAAAIAAYYSKMRNAGTVPVAYCERKYVFKRKGLKEGAVVMEHEKVIFVKPTLP
ncbi:MAG TPA: NFACT RNA binding domain-containing protein, partial [Bacteroidota bacterium]|nr:NFACT RNA binding domain-containing protein [Bacteroidota bacterium]